MLKTDLLLFYLSLILSGFQQIAVRFNEQGSRLSKKFSQYHLGILVSQ